MTSPARPTALVAFNAELVLGRKITVARCTVELVMHRLGIAGLPGRPRYRTIPNTPTASDLVNRDFARTEPNRLCMTDIERHEALLNLAVVKGHRHQFVAANWLKLRAA
jgi:hypothetical protein